MPFNLMKKFKQHEEEHVPSSTTRQQHATPSAASSDMRTTTQAAVDMCLLSASENGEIGGIGYWQVANAYSAIALHDLWSCNYSNVPKLCHQISLVAKYHPSYINEFNDDTLWWAHACLDLHSIWPDLHLVESAGKIYEHVSRFVLPPNTHCALPGAGDMAGAVLWTSKPDEENANTITTGLYAELAARLAFLEHDVNLASRYNDAARNSLAWILRCMHRRSDNVILDTIKLRTGEMVDWTFTYTTGQTIAVCAALAGALQRFPNSQHSPYFAQQSTRSHLQGQEMNPASLIRMACSLATSAMHREQWVDISGTGMLLEAGAFGREHSDPWANNDAFGFKGVLVRSLCKLYRTLRGQEKNTSQSGDVDGPKVAGHIKHFVERQYNGLREFNTNGMNQYGPWWAGPFEAPTSHSQLPVLDVMAGVHAVLD